MQRLLEQSDPRTLQFVWVAMTPLALGFTLDGLTRPIWKHFGHQATALEYVGDALAAAGYWLLWLLLPISALRPGFGVVRRGPLI